MAKFGIALGSGPRGRGFKSRHSDHCKTAEKGRFSLIFKGNRPFFFSLSHSDISFYVRLFATILLTKLLTKNRRSHPAPPVFLTHLTPMQLHIAVPYQRFVRDFVKALQVYRTLFSIAVFSVRPNIPSVLNSRWLIARQTEHGISFCCDFLAANVPIPAHPIHQWKSVYDELIACVMLRSRPMRSITNVDFLRQHGADDLPEAIL